jgi:hypothetical protein
MYCHRHSPALIKNRNKDEYSQNNLEMVSLLKTTKTIKISTKKKTIYSTGIGAYSPARTTTYFPSMGHFQQCLKSTTPIDIKRDPYIIMYPSTFLSFKRCSTIVMYGLYLDPTIRDHTSDLYLFGCPVTLRRCSSQQALETPCR